MIVWPACCSDAESAVPLWRLQIFYHLQKVNLAACNAIEVLLLFHHPKKQIWERPIWYLGNTPIYFSYSLENVDQIIPATDFSYNDIIGYIIGGFIIFG